MMTEKRSPARDKIAETSELLKLLECLTENSLYSESTIPSDLEEFPWHGMRLLLSRAKESLSGALFTLAGKEGADGRIMASAEDSIHLLTVMEQLFGILLRKQPSGEEIPWHGMRLTMEQTRENLSFLMESLGMRTVAEAKLPNQVVVEKRDSRKVPLFSRENSRDANGRDELNGDIEFQPIGEQARA
jgi:hypothetical protein